MIFSAQVVFVSSHILSMGKLFIYWKKEHGIHNKVYILIQGYPAPTSSPTHDQHLHSHLHMDHFICVLSYT